MIGRAIALIVAAVFLVGLFVASYLFTALVIGMVVEFDQQSGGRLLRDGDVVMPIVMLFAIYADQASSLFGLLSIALVALRVRAGLYVAYFAAVCRGTAMLATLVLWPDVNEVASSLKLLKPDIIPLFFIASLTAQGVTLLLMTFSIISAKAMLNELEEQRQDAILANFSDSALE
jgi:hypothetical protein